MSHVRATRAARAGWPRFAPDVEHALLVSFAENLSDATSTAVLALDQALVAAPPQGFAESVPAMVNLLITFDPLPTDHQLLSSHVTSLLDRPSPTRATGQTWEIEVCYEQAFLVGLRAVDAALLQDRKH